jgi:hypothetical protein
MYGTVYDVCDVLERVRSAANMSLSCEDCVIWTPRQSPAAPRRDPVHVRLTAGHTEAYKVNTPPVYTPRADRGDRPRGRAGTLRLSCSRLTRRPGRSASGRPRLRPAAAALSALGPPARIPHKFLTTNELQLLLHTSLRTRVIPRPRAGAPPLRRPRVR